MFKMGSGGTPVLRRLVAPTVAFYRPGENPICKICRVAATSKNLLCLADLRFRALAAAFEAFVAMARLWSAVIVFNRAFPPRRPISARYFEMSDFAIRTNFTTKAA
jgi:hypothetical protein